MMKLSILMPVYNEVENISTILEWVAAAIPSVDKELIIVDDGSKDGTRDLLAARFTVHSESDKIETDALGLQSNGLDRLNDKTTVHLAFHSVNQGKGGAIQTAMRLATGEVMVIQDADLEYDPRDWADMYDLIANLKVADVVYGSRFYGKPHRSLNFHHYVANRLISRIFSILYNQTLNDIEVCYKMFTRKAFQSLQITQSDFGFEVQISAQFAKGNWRMYETAIRYYGRTYDEGKKIGWRDGVKALWYLVKFRFVM